MLYLSFINLTDSSMLVSFVVVVHLLDRNPFVPDSIGEHQFLTFFVQARTFQLRITLVLLGFALSSSFAIPY
jgi:hypothetical protein